MERKSKIKSKRAEGQQRDASDKAPPSAAKGIGKSKGGRKKKGKGECEAKRADTSKHTKQTAGAKKAHSHKRGQPSWTVEWSRNQVMCRGALWVACLHGGAARPIIHSLPDPSPHPCRRTSHTATPTSMRPPLNPYTHAPMHPTSMHRSPTHPPAHPTSHPPAHSGAHVPAPHQVPMASAKASPSRRPAPRRRRRRSRSCGWSPNSRASGNERRAPWRA